MVMNCDYDLARPLQSALKAKAPYVGVPIPGHAPLIFQRDKLVRALKGVKPIHLYVEVYENGNRALIVDGVAGPRCRTHLKALSLQRNHLVRWGDPMKAAERWRRGLKPKPAATRDPLAKYRKELERLDKELAKLGSRPQIFNPAVATGPSYAHECELWRDWRAQKKLRGQVGRLAFLCRRGELDSRKLYAALRETVSGFDTFSDLTAYERRRKSIDNFHDYANPKTLWMRCKGLAQSWNGRPWTGRDDDSYGEEYPKWGAKRYTVVLEWIRERRELEDRIAAVKVMMEDAAAKHTGRC